MPAHELVDVPRGTVEIASSPSGARSEGRVGEAVAPRLISRVYPLDAIRGLLAIGVMVYHVIPGTPSFFGTWFVYGFFVISGFALEHVYGGRLDVRAFAVARVARLWPLWVPVVLVSAWLYAMTDPARLALNLTGAFGFVRPGETSIPTGGWSIGIEVVCYCLFPLLTRVSTRGLVVLTVATALLRVVYVNAVWPPGQTLADVWVAYTQLPAFLVFFVAGMTWARFGVPGPAWHGRAAGVATVLGDMSYGVYLLHPIVALAIGPWTLLVTPPLALAVRRLYEIPVGRWVRDLDLRDADKGRHRVPVATSATADRGVGPGTDSGPDRVRV